MVTGVPRVGRRIAAVRRLVPEWTVVFRTARVTQVGMIEMPRLPGQAVQDLVAEVDLGAGGEELVLAQPADQAAAGDLRRPGDGVPALVLGEPVADQVPRTPARGVAADRP